MASTVSSDTGHVDPGRTAPARGRPAGLRLQLAAAAFVAFALPPAQAQAPVEYFRLVPGFLREATNQDGMPAGNGFAAPNPWGAYTAYVLSTNAKGQRTWRIENFLPNRNGLTAQGSTMYLFEGSERALLVDTAQNTPDVPGQNDLKTIVKYLLGHNDDGTVKNNPVDFVVANTHFHGDHTGKNGLMSDRTVYYPDVDWPRNNAPSNYVHIKEGGGPSNHGTGKAVGEIALGDRTIVAIDIPEHTPGSTAYLDRENQMVATGDAIGSAFVWAQFGMIQQYKESLHHLQEVVRPYDHLTVLPAHFYQNAAYARGKAPLNGKPVDRQYIDDQVKAADGIMDGTVIGEPYHQVGRNAVIGTVASAQIVYSLANLYKGGVFGGLGDRAVYHAITIPGKYRTTEAEHAPFAKLDNIKSGFYLIRDYANESMYLIVGSSKALLVGTGSGTPGVAAFVKKLAGSLPVEVAVTSDEPGQVGALEQFASNKIYLPKGVTVAAAGVKSISYLSGGDTIELGTDTAGRALSIQVYPLAGHSATGVTLLDVNERVLLAGDALGTQGNDAGLVLRDSLANFETALEAWRAGTDGKYDVVYTAHNHQWYTSPAYVDQLQTAVKKGIADGDVALIDSTRMPGSKMIRSAGAPDVVASVVVAK